jgi:hypothetical protein
MSNVLLVEVPAQFIALCESNGVNPKNALRGMAAMVCGLRYNERNELLPLEESEIPPAQSSKRRTAAARASA